MANGPLVVVDERPGATVAVGVWLRRGSAHEGEDMAGAMHLLEHLELRRCGERTPEQIAALIDGLGGAVDAFTTRESCAVTAHVPAERWRDALDLLLDAVARPRFEPGDLETEKGVIAAEFEMVQDSPGEVAAELALEACWGAHPLARPVLGRRERVQAFSVANLEDFHARTFTLDDLLAVGVGPLPEAAVREAVAALPLRGGGAEPLPLPPWRPAFRVEEREGIEQVYVNIVFPGLPLGHPEALALAALEQLLGAGASSRLFRELRDRHGLVYEVDASTYAASVGGVLEVTFSAPAAKAEACWGTVLRVLEEVGEGKISDGEVALARQALDAAVVLGAEGNDALLDAHVAELLAHGRPFDADRLRREIAAVTPEAVRAVAQRLVRLELMAGAACGPVGVRLPAVLERRVA
jgi:predicted Zn-dependent peptidase